LSQGSRARGSADALADSKQKTNQATASYRGFRYAPRLIGLAPGTAGSPKHGRQRNVLLHRTT